MSFRLHHLHLHLHRTAFYPVLTLPSPMRTPSMLPVTDPSPHLCHLLRRRFSIPLYLSFAVVTSADDLQAQCATTLTGATSEPPRCHVIPTSDVSASSVRTWPSRCGFQSTPTDVRAPQVSATSPSRLCHLSAMSSPCHPPPQHQLASSPPAWHT